MRQNGHVLVIGAAGVDYKGLPDVPLQSDTPGVVRVGYGGVARNIAENLARLEVNVILLTALGHDAAGMNIIQHGQAAGINLSHVLRCPDARTSSYLAILNPAGELVVSVSDNHIMDHIDAPYLESQHALFEAARLLVIDLNLNDATVAYVLDMAQRYAVPVVVDPTSPVRAARLCNLLDRIYMVTPNAAETTTLCGLTIPAHDLDSAIKAAHQLVTLGTEIAIVTLGEQGLAYAYSSGMGHIPAPSTRIVDATGAGDALTAGVIFGLLNDVPLDDAMRLGVTAASLTLQSLESVSPDLTPDRLYDSLVV